MKILLTVALMLTAGGGAMAFELPALDMRGVAERAVEAPQAKMEKAGEPTVESAFGTIKDYYNSSVSYAAQEADLPGVWEGRIFMRDPQGYLEPQPIQITFSKKVTPSELGPLFQDDKAETYVQFPYFEALLERKVSFDPKTGASFQFRWEGLHTVSFRKLFRGNELVLVMKSDCYTGDTYAYFMKKKTAARQAYNGPLPTGDLFGPLPPYFHGQIGPMIRNGYEVPGVLEYHSDIIYYADKAAAQAAAENAAAKLRAAGRTVVSVSAEKSGGAWTASVGFSGKTGVLFRWDDELPTREEAAEIMKRKIERYEREGYVIMETSLNKLGQKYAFFIVCAKFL